MKRRRFAGFGMILVGLLGFSLFKELVSGLVLTAIGMGTMLLALVLVVGGSILVTTKSGG